MEVQFEWIQPPRQAAAEPEAVTVADFTTTFKLVNERGLRFTFKLQNLDSDFTTTFKLADKGGVSLS